MHTVNKLVTHIPSEYRLIMDVFPINEKITLTNYYEHFEKKQY